MRSPGLRRSPRLLKRSPGILKTPSTPAPSGRKTPGFYNRGSAPKKAGLVPRRSDRSVDTGISSNDLDIGQTLTDVRALRSQIGRLESVLLQQIPTPQTPITDTSIVEPGPSGSLTQTPTTPPARPKAEKRRDPDFSPPTKDLNSNVFGITETAGPQPIGRVPPVYRSRNFSFSRREWNRLRRVFLGGDIFLNIQGQRSLTKILDFLDALFPLPGDMAGVYKRATDLSIPDFNVLGKSLKFLKLVF